MLPLEMTYKGMNNALSLLLMSLGPYSHVLTALYTICVNWENVFRQTELPCILLANMAPSLAI